MYTISEWLTELWRWKQRIRTTLLKSYTRRKRREESSKNLSWDVEREGNPQKNLTWDKEHEQALQSVSRNPGCFDSWESSKNETNVTVSGLYKPLISNRSGFLPRPWDWSTHPGPDELTASKRGLWRILDLKSRSRPLQDFDYRPCYFQLIDLRSNLFATYWSLPKLFATYWYLDPLTEL